MATLGYMRQKKLHNRSSVIVIKAIKSEIKEEFQSWQHTDRKSKHDCNLSNGRCCCSHMIIQKVDPCFWRVQYSIVFCTSILYLFVSPHLPCDCYKFKLYLGLARFNLSMCFIKTSFICAFKTLFKLWKNNTNNKNFKVSVIYCCLIRYISGHCFWEISIFVSFYLFLFFLPILYLYVSRLYKYMQVSFCVNDGRDLKKLVTKNVNIVFPCVEITLFMFQTINLSL